MRILALNGGGTLGYGTACFLAQLEAATRPCREQFDLITGTSTGALIAAALATGMKAADIVTLYERDIPRIFKARWQPWRGLLGVPYYNRANLDAVTREVFGGALLSGVPGRLMIVATMLTPEIRPEFWKSWRAGNGLLTIAEAVAASASAPVFFEPARVGANVYVDGGLVANNPAHAAVIEALALGATLPEISCVNVWPGGDHGLHADIAVQLDNAWRWAPRFASVAVDANQEIAEYQNNVLLGARSRVVRLGLQNRLDTWSADLKNRALNAATAQWAIHGAALVAEATTNPPQGIK